MLREYPKELVNTIQSVLTSNSVNYSGKEREGTDKINYYEFIFYMPDKITPYRRENVGVDFTITIGRDYAFFQAEVYKEIPEFRDMYEYMNATNIFCTQTTKFVYDNKCYSRIQVPLRDKVFGEETLLKFLEYIYREVMVCYDGAWVAATDNNSSYNSIINTVLRKTIGMQPF